MLKIERAKSDRAVVLTLTGRLTAENISALSGAIAAVPTGQLLVLDLTDVILADREAIRFLLDCQVCEHIRLRHCPAFVRAWMAREAKS